MDNASVIFWSIFLENCSGIDIQACQEPIQLYWGDRYRIAAINIPVKMTLIQDFVEHPEAGSVVIDALDAVSAVIGEYIERLVSRIHAEPVSDECAERIGSASKVDGVPGKIDVFEVKIHDVYPPLELLPAEMRLDDRLQAQHIFEIVQVDDSTVRV